MILVNHCRQWIKRRRHCYTSNAELFGEAAKWQASPQAVALLKTEQIHIDDLLSNRFGYHLARYSLFTGLNLSRNSRISHQFEMSDDPSLWQQPIDASRTAIDADQLPFDNESIDVVVLHHCLEFSAQPHQLLREAKRILMPRGHLIITSFNPYSPWGLYSIFGRFVHPNPIWRRRQLSLGSVKDWLALLEFNSGPAQPHFYRPPIANSYLLDKMQGMESLAGKTGGLNWGGSYTIAAQKDVRPLTPIKSKMTRGRAAGGLVTASPVNRGNSEC